LSDEIGFADSTLRTLATSPSSAAALRTSEAIYASRSLVKGPCFAAVAVLSLALGIGANFSIFNLLERLLLTTLAVRDPHTLYQTGSYLPNGQFRNWAPYVGFQTVQATPCALVNRQ
jgi:hypothetical protein